MATFSFDKPRRICLYNQKTGEREEFPGEIKRSSCLDLAQGEDKTAVSMFCGANLQFSVVVEWKSTQKLIDAFEAILGNNTMRKRKTSYRTIRRMCAKRNRHK